MYLVISVGNTTDRPCISSLASGSHIRIDKLLGPLRQQPRFNETTGIWLERNSSHNRPPSQKWMWTLFLRLHECFLEWNKIWSSDTDKYIFYIVSRFCACRSTAKTKRPDQVPLSSLSNNFNELVSVDRIFLDGLPILLAMDAQMRNPVGLVCDELYMSSIVNENYFENVWLSLSWKA